MNNLVFIPVVTYVVLVIILLLREVRIQKAYGRIRTSRESALGRYSFGAIVIAMTLAASNLGPADTMGLSEEGAKYGFFFLMFPLLAGLQHIIAGKFFAQKIALQSENCLTMGDKMGDSVSKPTRVIVGIVTVLQTLAFTGILTLAGGKILTAVFGLPLIIGIMVTAIFVATYAYAGGMNAIISTDILQFFIVVLVAIFSVLGAMFLLMRNWGSVDPNCFWRPDGGDFTVKAMLNLAVAYFLGEAFLPMYTIRTFISKKPKDASKAFMSFGVIIIVYYAIMIFVGISSNLLTDESSISDIAIVNVLSSLTSVPWLKWIFAGCAFAALLGLTHSTLDSVLNAGATSLVKDVLDPFFQFSDSQLERQIRGSLVLIAIFGTLFSLVSDNLIEILLIGYTIWVPTIVFPFAYIILKSNKVYSNKSAFWGILGGILGYLIGEYLLSDLWIPSILTGFLMNAGFFLINEFRASRRN